MINILKIDETPILQFINRIFKYNRTQYFDYLARTNTNYFVV